VEDPHPWTGKSSGLGGSSDRDPCRQPWG
jgi:hypothetical protein